MEPFGRVGHLKANATFEDDHAHNVFVSIPNIVERFGEQSRDQPNVEIEDLIIPSFKIVRNAGKNAGKNSGKNAASGKDRSNTQ